METEQTPASPQDYAKILASDPTDEQAAHHLMAALIGTQRADEALLVCRKFHAAGGVSASVSVNAVYLFSNLIYDEDGMDIASAMLERARRRYPNDAGVWDASYWLSSHKHDYRQAMSHAAKAASLNPDIAFQCLRIHTPLTV